MLKNPAQKYRAFPTVDLPERQWPGRTIKRAPVWMSTDLRDGNQALFEPMNAERKHRFFKTLVEIGFKEIEVAFPSASQTDFDFVRELINNDLIPDDVTIEVLTQSREHLIRRTMESLVGARRAIVHLYNAIAPAWRRDVFQMSRAEVVEMAVSGARLVRDLAAEHPETEWVFQYSPETFSSAELDFALEISERVTDVFAPTPERKMILNLPATVEMATPNVYADQVEWMHTRLSRRDSTVLSVHPHNDRGCAVAAAELAVMAGADRVEGCLFGNGERTGNVDIVTLALNLYTQGVDPGLDFSQIDRIARTVEHCNELPVHPRHPYAGDLVFTAFSGSHQDAIKKGLERRVEGAVWDVPYLPIDPKDLGRDYAAIIRVNSQSGKGGIAFLLEDKYAVALPRRMLVEFSGFVQERMDETGRELSADDIWALLLERYAGGKRLVYRSHAMTDESGSVSLELRVHGRGDIQGKGTGALEACVNALLPDAEVAHFEERAIGRGKGADALAVVELALPDGRAAWGAGVDANIVVASFKAVVAAADELTR